MPQTASPTTLCTDIAGIPVVKLAQQFGTPVYIYVASKIVERINDLKAFNVTIRYAQKACSNLAILNLMRQQGLLIDTVSAGEIHRALAAGFKPHYNNIPTIVYTADVFDRQALDLVQKYKLHVNIGSIDMLHQLAIPGQDVTLRINPGFGHGHSKKTNTGGDQSKHGIWYEQIDTAIALARKLGLRVTGLHMHIGSGTDMEHLAKVCGAMEIAALKVGVGLTTISAGGGLPVPYQPLESHINLPEYFGLWDATRHHLEQEFGHSLNLEIEPGRYLVAESGYLVTEIRAVKYQAANLFYLVDAGFNNLARPTFYGAYHPMAIALLDSKIDSTSNQEELDVVVGGPLCESGDIFTQAEDSTVLKRRLPKAKVGDYLVIGIVGAYGFTMSSNYNSKPLAAEVLIKLDQKPYLIRTRQTLDELMHGEIIP